MVHKYSTNCQNLYFEVCDLRPNEGYKPFLSSLSFDTKTSQDFDICPLRKHMLFEMEITY